VAANYRRAGTGRFVLAWFARAAAAAIAAGQGEGPVDIVFQNDRPVDVVAAELMTFLRRLPG
jgi:hypothetical protein